MSRQHCEICGQPIGNIDFYLTIKEGTICPACLLAQRTANYVERQDYDTASQYAAIPGNQLSGERQLFF